MAAMQELQWSSAQRWLRFLAAKQPAAKSQAMNQAPQELTREQLLAAFPDFDSMEPHQQNRARLILKTSRRPMEEIMAAIPPEFHHRKMFTLVHSV